jgi:hypothetical protein
MRSIRSFSPPLELRRWPSSSHGSCASCHYEPPRKALQASRADFVVRRVLVGLLALGTVAVVLDRLGAGGKLTLFPLLRSP